MERGGERKGEESKQEVEGKEREREESVKDKTKRLQEGRESLFLRGGPPFPGPFRARMWTEQIRTETPMHHMSIQYSMHARTRTCR